MARDGTTPLTSDGDGNMTPYLIASSISAEIKPLTRQNLARFNALNGTAKDSDIDSAYLFDDDSATIKEILMTTSIFEQRLCQNSILDPVTPNPLPDGNTLRVSPNAAPAPSRQSMRIKHIAAGYPVWRIARGRAITEIPSEHFNDGLSNAHPDILEGLLTEGLPDNLRDSYALHKKRSLSFCHFAAEFEPPDGNLRQATVQAAYDGALMVSARERALAQASTLGTSNRDALERAAAETAVFTCVTDGKVVEVYGHRSQCGQYHQKLVARESLLDSNRGRELIRNAQDYARGKSYELANLLGADLWEEEGEEEEVVVVVKAQKTAVETKE